MVKDYKVIMNVSMSQLSVARHYGGCNVNGKEYIYHPLKDALIRKDLMKHFKKAKTWEDFIELIKPMS